MFLLDKCGRVGVVIEVRIFRGLLWRGFLMLVGVIIVYGL